MCGGTLGTVTTDARTAALMRAVADRMLAAEDDIVRDMDDAAFELVPALDADAAIAAEVSASNRANLHRVLSVARHADAPAPAPADVPPEALDIARTLARRGIEVDAIFQGYRGGQQVAWRRWLEAASAVVGPGPELTAVLDASLILIFAYVDDVLRRVIAEAQREREEILGGALARRTETARLLLEDSPIDEATASRQLGYDLSRRHTGMVLWAEAPGVPQGGLESAAGILARAAGAGRPFTMAAGTSTLWVWMAGGADPAAAGLRAALLTTPAAIRAAVGPAVPGIAGFRRTHEAALAVHRILAGHPQGERLVTYAQLEVTALAARDERRAAQFVAATLGPLAADDAHAARLRETLRIFLEEADNAPRAAKRLHVHRNTVLQRVARASDLLQHDPRDRRLALHLALEVAHQLGPRVLTR
jgi:DNA-binding PucR family transcriptional regulator